MATRLLGPDEVQVWCVSAETTDDATRGRCEALLTPEEAARRERYLQPRSRDEFLLARALVRTVLADYTGIPANDLRFTTTATGKPTLTPDAPPLHFNLSHSHGLVVCAVAAGGPVGVDVEDASRTLAYLDLAERYFAPPEVAHLRGLDETRRRAAFFAIWTLKEAFVKAIGQGLSFPLDSFAFELDEDRCVGFRPPTSLPGRHWQIVQFQPTPRHQGAVIVEMARDVAFRVSDGLPLLLPA